ncbi:uncharacterized protein LOC132888186 isoform X2 [Neoarius graeffei]|uniref:uncharacterized protein LOC132888186 isoform X2 n=1 Tax=Neoarius graeffei TaxID=443677 RepID=UPI00298D44E1|nr:uncharacterized protein LOC132888186 isoform X2 [Neoarius graeffei]XP_060780220.1 uncharacterized protein LOC132888186 isoform X2 [Neoarius graeffei]
MMDNDLEAVWVNILLPKTKPILLSACYRPPDVNNFYNILEEVCSNAEGFVDSEVIITGDFNTNVSTSKANSLVNSLKYFCSMFDLHQMITEPTRVCESSQTTIDLMLVSDQDKICQSGVITCGMSDHMAIYCTRKVLRSKATGHNTIKVRSMKHYTAEVFCERLSMIDWSSVLNCMNVDQAWRNFTTMFIYVLDSIAPVKSISVKHRTEPWVSTEILEAINRRDQALKESKKSNDQSEFKRLRNKVNRMIDKSKVDYYKNNLQLNHNNPKKLWQLCKQLGSSKKQKSNFSIGLKIDGIVSFNLTAVVLKFNSFFTTIATILVDSLPIPSTFGQNHINNFYKTFGVQQDAFALSTIEVFEVRKMLRTLDSSKATGLDNIPARFVIDAAELIAPSITHIIRAVDSFGWARDKII